MIYKEVLDELIEIKSYWIKRKKEVQTNLLEIEKEIVLDDKLIEAVRSRLKEE